jgi:hypothetical protein
MKVFSSLAESLGADVLAHQIAVAFLDHIAEVDADAKLDPPLSRQPGIALDHGVLHLDGATHRIHNAAKFGEHSITSALDDATVIDGDRWINDITTKRPEPGQGPLFVCSSQPAKADDVGSEYSGKFPTFCHR